MGNGGTQQTAGTFTVENPATGKTLTTMAPATRYDATATMNVAAAAQGAWARTSSRYRSEI